MIAFSLKNVLVLSVGAVGCAFIAYAVYFDYKRRSAKDYKEIIRLRRSFERQQKYGHKPNLFVNYNGMQHIFLQEVQLGEEKLLDGFVQEGIDHLSNAIVMCNKPEQVMGIFRRTLPDDHYLLLQSAVPEARQRFARLLTYTANAV